MRRGMTLFELLVVLVLLGLMSGISALSLRPFLGVDAPTPAQMVERRRDSAAFTGHPISWMDSTGARVRVLPDGRVLRSHESANAP